MVNIIRVRHLVEKEADMRNILGLIIVLSSVMVSGCATTMILEDGTRTKVINPCANDALCFSNNTYEVVWDN